MHLALPRFSKQPSVLSDGWAVSLLAVLLWQLSLLALHVGLYLANDPARIVPQLFGAGLLVSTAVAGLVAVPALLAGWYLRRQGVERPALLAFFAAACGSAWYFHISANTSYTNDVAGHLHYVIYLLNHWDTPFSYLGVERHHPPVYYAVAALFHAVADAQQYVDPRTALRYLSWLCYLVFNAFGLLALRQLGLPRAHVLTASALFALWPGGLHLATKISNEPMFYAFYAVSFYFMLRWYRQGGEGQLLRALLFAGLAFAVRSNGAMLFIILAPLLLVAWCRGRFSPRIFFRARWFVLACALLACVAVNLGTRLNAAQGISVPFDSFYGKEGPPPYYNNRVFPLAHYLHVSPSLMYDYPFALMQTREGGQPFWNYLLQTALFGEYRWPVPPSANLPGIMNLLVLALAFYTFLPWLCARRAAWGGMLPMMLGVFVPVAMLLLYTASRNFPFSQDIRFIYPVIIAYAGVYGRSLAMYSRPMAWLGQALAFALIALGAFYFTRYFR